MSNQPTSFIDEVNKVRTNPKEYSKILLSYEKYFNNKIFHPPELKIGIETNEGFSAFKEAAEELVKTKPLEPLSNKSLLNDIAYDILTQNTDTINEDLDINKIISQHGEYFGPFAHSIDFGSSTVQLCICNLLADESSQSRPNRKNILSQKYKLIGVSHGKQNEYGVATVLCFSRHFFGKGEDHGELSDECYENKNPEIKGKGEMKSLLSQLKAGKK
jgi:hypothetical protein